MLFRWWVAMHGQNHQCKAKQGCRGKTALTSGATPTVVRFLGGAQGGEWISLVTMTGAFLIGSACRCGPFILIQR
jgi:hypothetical protein